MKQVEPWKSVNKSNVYIKLPTKEKSIIFSAYFVLTISIIKYLQLIFLITSFRGVSE